jgi:hypothetical protein
MDSHLKLSEIKNIGQLTEYGNGFYKINKQWWKNIAIITFWFTTENSVSNNYKKCQSMKLTKWQNK